MKIPAMLLIAVVWTCRCTGQSADSAAARPDKQLQAVTVVSKRPVVRQEAGRIIYDLQADPQSKASSVLDMMRKVPYLAVDDNGHILLQGSSGYKIYINGRPAGIIHGDPGDVLRSIPASTVKSIEVILHPPAGYDAEGLAGIINIVMMRQVRDGYKGAVNISEKYPAGGPGAGGSFTAKARRLDLSVMAGLNSYRVPEADGKFSRIVSGTNPSALVQDLVTRSQSRTGYADVALSYEPDSLNLISVELDWRNTLSAMVSTQASATTSTKGQQYYLLHADNADQAVGLDATANYQRGFKRCKEQLLTFSYRYNQHDASLYSNASVTDELNYSLPDYRQYNKTSVTEHAGQIDYLQPFRKLMMGN